MVNESIMLTIYVDDMLVTKKNDDKIATFKGSLKKIFEISWFATLFFGYSICTSCRRYIHASNKVCA